LIQELKALGFISSSSTAAQAATGAAGLEQQAVPGKAGAQLQL